jgi:hypothetical protein
MAGIGASTGQSAIGIPSGLGRSAGAFQVQVR